MKEVAAAFGVSKRTAYRYAADPEPAPAPADPWLAACMDPDEWAAWRGANDRLQNKGKVARPCADCTLGFAAEMRAIGRCNGTPAGVERDEIEEELTMDQPARAVERLHIDEATQTRVEVQVTAPCPGCAHAPVCGIRASLEALTDVAVRLPKLDEAIGLRLTAAATCGHYLAVPGARKPKRELSPAALASARTNAAIARQSKGGREAEGVA